MECKGSSGPTQIKSPPTLGSSPWGKVKVTPPCSLTEVMSEELVDQMQNADTTQETNQIMSDAELAASLSSQEAATGTETNDDLLLAQMLQHEFDREHDKLLQKQENKYNGDSKVSISFTNFRSVHPHLQDDIEDSSSDDDDDDVIDWHTTLNAPEPQFNRFGVSGSGKSMVTKHDAGISSRRNANKIMEQFPPGFQTGDDTQFDMKLNNKVYNKLKSHSIAENKRSQRLHEKKEHSTSEQAIDPRTKLIMYKLVNNEILESINGVISTGKEAVVFHANGGRIEQQQVPCECAIKVYKTNLNEFKNRAQIEQQQVPCECAIKVYKTTLNEFKNRAQIEQQQVPCECAIKVYKTTLNEFKNRAQYVKGDYRYFKDEFKKQNPRKIMNIWAEKEKTNLKKMRRHGILCPEPVLLRKHVLVMSFIGHNQQSAPKLKEAVLNGDQLQSAYSQCIQALRKLYCEAGLVHADFSEYNILWHNGCIYIIDVSQSVDLQHPQALVFLLRDCLNITEFFSRKGVENVPSQYELFNDITGLNFTGQGEDFVSQIQEYEKNEDRMRRGIGKEYAFDHFFSQSTKERENLRKNTGQSDQQKSLQDLDIDDI
ncbi:unnamed protein product [Owenia fusiformis]|uniref:Serine/threonine-protein kinase RIO3 n=1 Tax=Owenia fusiformis TaxID=6347 RepID=A0A8J1TN08_OWEFU|nr:unnamed protein product [Owenia fusiformis]